MKTINIAIADDQMLFRRGMAGIINTFENMTVICEADNGHKLLGFLETTTQKPDVILMDLSMPELNGIDTMKFIHEKYPEQKVIILSIHNEEKFVIYLIELGASAYLFKNSEPEDVEKAIRGVIEKGFYFSEDTLTTLHKRLTNKKLIDNKVLQKIIYTLLARAFTYVCGLFIYFGLTFIFNSSFSF